MFIYYDIWPIIFDNLIVPFLIQLLPDLYMIWFQWQTIRKQGMSAEDQAKLGYEVSMGLNNQIMAIMAFVYLILSGIYIVII